MESALPFLERCGINDPPRVLKSARLGPYASVADVAALPNNVVYFSGQEDITKALVSARNHAQRHCNYCLDFRDSRHGLFKQHTPSPVGGASPAPGRNFGEATRLGRPLSTTGSGLNPLEHIASGHEVSAWDVVYAFRWVFEEDASVKGSIAHSYVRPDGHRAYSFEERCRASGCGGLVPAVSLDTGIRKLGSRDSLPPTKRMRLERNELNSMIPRRDVTDLGALRLPQNLALEASIRTQFAAIKKSWRTYRAGIASYAQFMSDSLPQVRHFPVTLISLRLWANHFDNGDTLQNYIAHLNFAHRILSLPEIEARDVIHSILRGAKRDQTRSVKPRVVGTDLDKMVKAAVSEDDLLAARAYAVAYAFLFRCRDELFGLQIDGRGSEGPHHSHITFKHRSSSSPASATVHLTSRKNAQTGATISRPCICKKGFPSLRCGPCALAAAARSHLAGGGSKTDSIFGGLRTRRASAELRRRGLNLGIIRCSWHAFRRGAASDIVRSGGTIGFLLNQGGWKSSTFLKYLLSSDIEDRRALESTAAGLDSDSE